MAVFQNLEISNIREGIQNDFKFGMTGNINGGENSESSESKPEFSALLLELTSQFGITVERIHKETPLITEEGPITARCQVTIKNISQSLFDQFQDALKRKDSSVEIKEVKQKGNYISFTVSRQEPLGPIN